MYAATLESRLHQRWVHGHHQRWSYTAPLSLQKFSFPTTKGCCASHARPISYPKSTVLVHHTSNRWLTSSPNPGKQGIQESGRPHEPPATGTSTPYRKDNAQLQACNSFDPQ